MSAPAGDIALFWDATLALADFGLTDHDLATDEGLETAILISLFTDRRAGAGDVLPDGEEDRRGWWGDAFGVPGDLIGSRLWLLDRSTQSAANLATAEEYAREALQWLIDDKVAEAVKVTASYPARGWRLLDVEVKRPGLDSVHFKYHRTWGAQALRTHP